MLPARFDGPFSWTREPGSPVVSEDEPGLRLAVADVRYADGALSFQLLLAFGFPDVFFHAFRDLPRSIVVELQDADDARAVSFPLIDPTFPRLEEPLVNFEAPALDAAPSVAFVGGCVAVKLNVAVPEGTSLHTRAVLQRHRSNVVVVAAGSPS